MTRKATRPCLCCGRRIAIHRGKRLVCSEDCRKELKRARKPYAWRAGKPRP